MAVKNLMQITDMSEIIREEIAAQTGMECGQVYENNDDNGAQDKFQFRAGRLSDWLLRMRAFRGFVFLLVLDVFYHRGDGLRTDSVARILGADGQFEIPGTFVCRLFDRLIMTGMRSQCLS